MASRKNNHPPNLKAKVALELIKEKETISAVCSRYGIHPTQAGRWKEQALKGIQTSFYGTAKSELKQKDELIERLYSLVGKRDIELEWVKKKMELVSLS